MTLEDLPRADPVDLAARHLSAGRADAASTILEDMLRKNPRDARAIAGLGAVALHRGDLERARDLAGTAASLTPNDSWVVANLGAVYMAEGKRDEAVLCYERAIDLDPEMAGAYSNLGSAQFEMGQVSEALESFRSALDLDPARAAFHANYGQALLRLGRYREAEQALRAAIRLDPACLDGWLQFGDLLRRTDRPAQAVEALDEALLHAPGDVTLLAKLTEALVDTGRGEEAEARIRRALVLQPKSPVLRLALVNALIGQDKLNEAIAILAELTQAMPAHPLPPLLLGRALRRQGKVAAALHAYNRARDLSDRPDHVEPLRIEPLLTLGLLEEAWEAMDATRSRPQGPNLLIAAGGPDGVRGRPVRLVAGNPSDALFALRYLPRLASAADAVEIVAPPLLAPLLECAAGVDRVTAAASMSLGDPVRPANVLIGDLSELPRFYRSRPGDVPPPGGVLTLPSDRVSEMAGLLPAGDAPRVGFWWEGDGPDPDAYAGLIAAAGAGAVLLQTGAARTAIGPAPAAVDLGPRLGSYRDLAAAIAGLDLVVAPDGPIAHLAGCLGIRCLVFVPRLGSWHWLCDRDDSPWYPDLTLLRQADDGGWTDAVGRAAAAVSRPEA